MHLIKLKKLSKRFRKSPSNETVWHFNTVVMGIQNYYSAATQNYNIILIELNSYLRKSDV